MDATDGDATANAYGGQGMRFKAVVTHDWIPLRGPGANPYIIDVDLWDRCIVYDDDSDMVYDDPEHDGWSFVKCLRTGQLGFVPELCLQIEAAITPNPAKPLPTKPEKPTDAPVNNKGKSAAKLKDKTDPKVNKGKHPPPKATKGTGQKKKASGCCGGGTPPPKGNAGKTRALEMDEEDSDTDDDSDVEVIPAEE